MLRIYFLLGMIVAAVPLSAQDLRVCTDQKGRCGYADLQGNVVVPCKYETAFPFRNGVGKVGKGDKFGLVNAVGKEILPLKYEEVVEWGNGLYRIRSGNDYGLVSRAGDVKLQTKYSMIGRLNCYGKAYVADGGSEKKGVVSGAKVGIVDADGRLLIAPQYTSVSEFSSANGRPVKNANSSLSMRDTLKTAGEYLSCFDGKKNVVVDGQGNAVTPLTDKAVYLLPTYSMCGFTIQDGSNVTSGYWDMEAKKQLLISNKVKQLQAHICTPFTGQVAKIDNTTSRTSYFIDKKGKALTDECTKVKYKDEYWIGYDKTKKPVLLHESGKILLANSEFQDLRFPEKMGTDIMIPAKKSGKWGVVNGLGQTLVPFEYDDMKSPSAGWICAVKGGKCGVIDTSGKVIVPFQYSDIAESPVANSQNLWVRAADSLYYNFDVSCQQTVGDGMRVVTAFEDGMAWVVPARQQIQDNSILNGLKLKYNIRAASLVPVSFGVLVDTKGNQKTRIPTPQALRSALYDAIRKNGDNLTYLQEKRFLLDVTRATRVYSLTGEIAQEEWDY